MPDLSIDKINTVLPAALSFALLGGIESLLSAVVADSMSGRRHRSNCELAAQGFGEHRLRPVRRLLRHRHDRPYGHERPRRRPRTGLGHAALAVPACFHDRSSAAGGYIPLAALAAVLAVVAWNMAEKHEFATLIRASRSDAVVLLATFLLVVFRDLTEGILAGFGISSLVFLQRMAEAVEIEPPHLLPEEDRADTDNGNGRKPYDAAIATDPDVVVYRITVRSSSGRPRRLRPPSTGWPSTRRPT